MNKNISVKELDSTEHSGFGFVYLVHKNVSLWFGINVSFVANSTPTRLRSRRGTWGREGNLVNTIISTCPSDFMAQPLECTATPLHCSGARDHAPAIIRPGSDPDQTWIRPGSDLDLVESYLDHTLIRPGSLQQSVYVPEQTQSSETWGLSLTRVSASSRLLAARFRTVRRLQHLAHLWVHPTFKQKTGNRKWWAHLQVL